MKLGLFGATLDPPHSSHIKIVESAIDQFNLDKVIVVPTDKAVHKEVATPLSHRLKMAKIAFRNTKEVRVMPLDDGKSYSYLPVDKVQNLYDQVLIYFIMGADSFLSLNTWHNFNYLKTYCVFLVANRNYKDGADIISPINNSKELFGTFIDYEVIQGDFYIRSSTDIRKAIETKTNNDDLDQKVFDYILENELYRSNNELK